MQEKKIKTYTCKAGGTASKNAKMVRMVIPADWAKAMNIDNDSPYVQATFDGEVMTIRKDDSDAENQG